MRGFHARDSQEGLVRAIVEGDLFLSARSIFFLSFFVCFFHSFILSFFFFSHPQSFLRIKIFVGRTDVLGEAPRGRNSKKKKNAKKEEK